METRGCCGFESDCSSARPLQRREDCRIPGLLPLRRPGEIYEGDINKGHLVHKVLCRNLLILYLCPPLFQFVSYL